MIRFENVSVSFGEKRVIKDLSFELPNSGLVLITGASGSGKTTVLRLILGLCKADSGEVITDKLRMATVFQEDRLLPDLTAHENVALVSNNKEAEKRLSEVGLETSGKLYPDELSGGMKRRVALARALGFGGDVLILDEAFSGVDEVTALNIFEKVRKEYSNKLIIAVTHRPELFKDYTEIKI